MASAAAAVATTDSAAPAPSQRAPSTQPYRTVPAASPHQTAAKLLDAARIATAQGRPLDYTRLIVRNLAFDVDDAALRAAFASAAAARVSRKPSGRSMGFGFVEFASMVDAKRERDALNNTILCARPMQIDFAQLDDKDSALKFAAARDAGKQAAASAATGASSTTAASNASVGSKRAAVSATTSASNGNDGTLAKKPKASAAVATIEPTAKKKLSKKQAKNQVKILNKLLASYGQKKDLGAALKAFARLERRGLKPTVHTYSSMVNACVRCGECARAEQFVEQMRARGVPPNEVTYTALIKGLCNADRLRDAVALLPACPQPNIRTFHALLRGCVRDAEGATAARVFAAMRAAQVEPDVHAYEYLIKVRTPELHSSPRFSEHSRYLSQHTLQAHAYSLETGAAWAALHELTEVLSKSASSAQEDPDASLFSTLALACTLVNEPDLARRALLGAERVLAHHQSSYLNVESTGSNRSRNNFSSSSSATSSSLSSNAQSQSHVMFERLSADETRRECDRVRMLLVTRAHALPAVLRAYGRFPTAAARVHLLPSADCTGTLQWAREFAPLKNATAKSSKSVPAATPASARKVKLEVCSGLGDWVVQHAESEPECDWVAVELRRDRVFQIWSKMVMRELTNLLVLGGDAHAIVRNSVASQTVDEVWINFPEVCASFI